jgi:regulator of sirC expression with transglutaminase-like and TPR domain
MKSRWPAARRTKCFTDGTMASLQDLPDPLIHIIFAYIPDYATVCRLGCTCRHLQPVAKDRVLWEALYRHRWTFLSPTTITKADYERRHKSDMDSLQYLDSLRRRNRLESSSSRKVLRLLLARGREAIDVCWQVHDVTKDEEYRRVVLSVIFLLQRISLFEDMVQLRNDTSIDPVERLEGYAILSSLLFSDTAYRNFTSEHANLRKRLDDIAATIKKRFSSEALSIQQKVKIMNQFLFKEEAFTGTVRNYYDFHNSLLHCCLDQKKAIPMTLAILYKLIGRRIGIDADIIGLPGHVLVGIPSVGCYVDVFSQGPILDQRALERIVNSYGFVFRRECLDPLNPEDILKRICNNLANCVNIVEEAWQERTSKQRVNFAILIKRLVYNPSPPLVEHCHDGICRLWINENVAHAF